VGGGGDGQERVRQHRQRDVAVPGVIEPGLVVIQAGFVLASSPIPACRQRSRSADHDCGT